MVWLQAVTGEAQQGRGSARGGGRFRIPAAAKLECEDHKPPPLRAQQIRTGKAHTAQCHFRPLYGIDG